MKSIWMRESKEKLAEVRETLKNEGVVHVVTTYETFYGVGWYNWLKEQLSDLDCVFEVKGVNKWDDFVDSVDIYLNK